jgi:hypothetical protein
MSFFTNSLYYESFYGRCLILDTYDKALRLPIWTKIKFARQILMCNPHYYILSIWVQLLGAAVFVYGYMGVPWHRLWQQNTKTCLQ